MISIHTDQERKAIPITVIDSAIDSYTGDGNVSMDKVVKGCYAKEGQELVVESIFVGERAIKDIIKEHILDRIYNKIEMATPCTECYNDARNTVVVASKEVIQ